MDEKKLEQVQNLNDEQLDDVSGGVRVPMERSRVVVIDADDGARCTEDEEELDGGKIGGIPHIPIVNPR